MAISLGQLDLKALKNYLKIVEGFRTVHDPAMDTEHVDGIAANLIAIAALVNNELLKDDEGNDRRDVINHALNLLRLDEEGNQEIVNANDVLTLQEGEELQETAVKASQCTAEDMRQLRNEMYHLKTKMIRSGSVSFDQVYNGWIDPFIHYKESEGRMDGRFTKDTYPCSPLNTNIVINGGNVSGVYDEGQFAVLLSNNEAVYVDEITKSNDGSILTLGDGTVFADVEPDTMQKSYGLYHKGQFVFANDNVDVANTSVSENMIFKDGPDRLKIIELNETEGVAGFATTIEVPAGLDENYLNAIGLSLRVIGKPGRIWCELYHYNNDAVYDPEYVVATSEYLNSDTLTSNWQTCRFHFRESSLRLESGHRYLLLIKCSGTWTDNVWCIGGFKEPCNLSIHQDTFIYRNNNYFLERIPPNVNTNEVHDAFIALYTTKNALDILNYSRYGAYTGTFVLENAQASRVRISFNPNLNGRQRNPELFRVEDFYKVNAKGLNKDGKMIPGKFDEASGIKEYTHTIISNNEVSANEYAYDFIFAEPVVEVEFQIMYRSEDVVDETKHGSLFSVVVSTDNAYLK